MTGQCFKCWLCYTALVLVFSPAVATADEDRVLFDPLDLVWTDPAPLSAETVANMAERHPGWTVAGSVHGNFTTSDANEVAVLMLDRPPLLNTPGDVHTAMVTIIGANGVRDIKLNFPATGFGSVIPGHSGALDALVLVHWSLRQGIENYDLAVVSWIEDAFETTHRFDSALVSTCGPDGSGQINGTTLTLFQDGRARDTPFIAPCSPP